MIGGRYDVYNERIGYFFSELAATGSKLVFFCRPFLNDLKEKVIMEAFDCVTASDLRSFQESQAREGKNLFPWHLDKRFLYNLVKICSGYGPIYTQLEDLTPRIVQYAVDHADEVLAMIQHDTDFLFFDAQFQYWSLADLDVFTLTTKKYCRQTLYERLNLNTKQTQLLSAISRIDDKFLKIFCRKIISPTERKAPRLFKLVAYMKILEKDGFDLINDLDACLKKIAIDIFGRNYEHQDMENIRNELKRYNLDITDELDKIDVDNRELAEFCREKFYFAYGLLMEDITINQALQFIDKHRKDAYEFVHTINHLQLKLCGILFKDYNDRPIKRNIKVKQHAHTYECSIVDADIIYPPDHRKLFQSLTNSIFNSIFLLNFLVGLSSTQQIIMDESNKEFDEARWSLFKWILDFDIETISNIKASNDSKYLRIVQFTLNFLLSVG